MKTKLFAFIATTALLLGMSGCGVKDDPAADLKAQEENLVGVWWDEFEISDVTEAGVPFSRALLAVKADADHTGCLYLGVFNDTSDEPLAVYGGPENAAFSWLLLADGSVLLKDPVSGESVALTRGASDSSYGEGMTDVSGANVTYADGSVIVTNSSYSGELVKADAKKEADIEELLSSLSPDRQKFEADLSQMLANTQQYIKLDPTMRAVRLLTDFVEQLKIEALGPQLTNILITVLQRQDFVVSQYLADADEEVRWALAHSNFANDTAKIYSVFNAYTILNHSTIEFTTGKDTAQYMANRLEDDAFTVCSKNASTGAVTKVKMKFSGADDGVAIFLGNFSDVPVAVQFPHMIDIELLRSETGNDADTELVMKGQLALESTDGKRFISLKQGEWRATLFTEAKKADRFELPSCALTHHADHTVEASVDLGINDKKVLSVKGHNFADPYTDEELEQLRVLRDIEPVWKGCYTLLKAFNSRSNKIEVTMADNIVFDIDIHDVGQCLKATANVLKGRKDHPAKEAVDPWTDMLNEAATFTVTQKNTGVKADGKFVTGFIAGYNLPSLALRFKGESSFRAIHDRMSPTDFQYYENLLKGFAEPLNAVNALLKVIQDKGVELKALTTGK